MDDRITDKYSQHLHARFPSAAWALHLPFHRIECTHLWGIQPVDVSHVIAGGDGMEQLNSEWCQWVELEIINICSPDVKHCTRRNVVEERKA